MYTQNDDNKDFEEELGKYQRGYLHAMGDFKRTIQLRNRDVNSNEGRLNPNKPSSSQQNTDKKK